MTIRDSRITSLPTHEQELLLKAALLTGEACRKAWKAWKSRIDIENLDYGSSRLLPLASLLLVRQKQWLSYDAEDLSSGQSMHETAG